MNLGYIASTIVGGLLILSIIGLNLRVSQHSGEATLYHTAKIQTDMLAEVLTHDLRQVGYGSGSWPIQDPVTTTELTYTTHHRPSCLLESDPDEGPWTIKWYYDDENASLLCSVNGGDDVEMGSRVTRFEFIYFDSTGVETLINEDIRRIKVSLITESVARYGNREQNPSSAWEAIFSPRSLNSIN